MYPSIRLIKIIIIFSFIALNANAQICSGNLGAPVFNEDFGSGSAVYGPALASTVTGYPYFTGVPFNGSYYISYDANASNTYGYVYDNDHTGDTDGYMMIVNSDYASTEIYRRNATNLCPNTTYVFSAYLANNNTAAAASGNCGSSYIYADVKFQVEYPTSIIQGSVTSGNLPLASLSNSLVWVQYGFAFTTGPTQTSVDVVMINNAPGGCGNDYVVDDITLSPCGPGVSLSISPNASVFCQGQPITLLSNFTSGTYTVPQYQWQFSNNNGLTWNDIVGATSANYPIAAVSNSNIGLYQLLVAENGNMSNSNCRIIAGPLTFSLASLSVNSSTICSGQTTTLSAFGASSYTWSNGATNNSITVTPNSTSSYSVMGSTGFCTLQAVSNVSVISAPTISVVGNTLICQGNTTTLTASGYTNYLWSNGSTAPAIVISPSATSLYSVTSSISLCANIGIVTVSVIPVPTVSISPSIACVGQSFTITSNASSGVTFQWAGPNSFISSLQNPTFVTANISMSGVYNLTVTNTQGCVNTANANVSVVPLPIPIISVNYTAICAGTNLNLIASGGNTYQWFGPNGFSSSIQNIFINNASVLAEGTYTLLAANGSCTASTNQSITVYPLPLPVANYTPACETKTFQLTANSSGVGDNYQWLGPNTFVSNLQNPPPFINANTSMAGTYTLTVTDVNNCKASIYLPVTVLLNPIVKTKDVTVCAGNSVTLTASGALNYMWNGPNGYSANTYSAFITSANLPLSQLYTVVGTAANSCTSLATANLKTIPVPTPSLNATSNAWCLNSTISLQGFGGDTYQWQGPYNFFASTQNVIFNAISLSYSGIYTLTAISNNGCSTKTTTNITINDLPRAELTSNITNSCVPFCADFKFKNTSASEITNFNWQIANTYTPTTNGFSTCIDKAGTYAAVGNFTNALTCTNTLTFSIQGFPQPLADFDYFPKKPIAGFDEVVFTDASKQKPIVGWNWFFKDNEGYKASTQQVNYLFENEGVYPVVLVVKNTWGCIDTVVKTITIDSDFSIFVPNAFTPNQDSNNEIFQPKGTGIVKYNIAIFDRWGEQLFETTDFNKGWDGTFKGQSCKSDVYVWKIVLTNKNDKTKELNGHVSLYR